MGVYEEMRTSRRLVHAGVWLGYATALGVLVVRVVNTGAGEALGSVALALAAAVAPTLARLSLDRRPGLLPVAALASLLGGVVSYVILPPALLTALIWLRAWSRRPVKGETTRRMWWSGVALGLAPVLATLTLFAHIDPVCTQTLADGTVVEVDPAERGMRPGWRLGSAGTFTVSGGGDGVTSSECASDTIVWWEAGLSAAISLAAVGAGRQWPVNLPRSRPSPLPAP